PFTLGVDATVRRLLAEGWLGEPLAVECRFPGGFLDRHAPLHWRQDMEISGFNIGMLGIAYETVLRWIGAATRVVALSRTFVRMRPDAEHRLREIRIPDHLDVLAEMACGAQLHFRHSPATALAPGPGFWLYGSEGTLRIHENALSGARRGETALSPIAIPESERGGWRVEEEFVGAIRGTEPVRLTTFAEGVRYMEFVEAVSRSLTEERVIPLPLA
ncbi:MAG: hypothetical protein U1E27_07055, partial [Kiritimatiellia bacterium]|nr:hypothetical protein [Kiritimatiellia bacterium]